MERAAPRLSSSSLALSPAATPSALLRVFTVFTLALKSRVMSTAMADGAAAQPSPRNAAPRDAFRRPPAPGAGPEACEGAWWGRLWGWPWGWLPGPSAEPAGPARCFTPRPGPPWRPGRVRKASAACSRGQGRASPPGSGSRRPEGLSQQLRGLSQQPGARPVLPQNLGSCRADLPSRAHPGEAGRSMCLRVYWSVGVVL